MNNLTGKYGQKFLRMVLALVLVIVMAQVAFAQGNLDLEKALKIGKGKTMVIEFTDPDCSFCKQAEAYFQGKGDQVTRYIFLLPLSIHPGAKEKIQYILSAKDKERAYMEVLSGRFDKSKASVTPEGIRLQKEHQDAAQANKITSTPTFMIYGRIVQGFDVQQLDPLIK
jgi:thiol:disulfide interchange protein DsbC